MKEYIDLVVTFFKIGIMTFGGGYAMLPMIQREVVEKRGWATEEEILNYYAIGQCTPGVIAVNTATFIGDKRKGILGGFLATLGVVMPSLIIISVIAAVLNNFAAIRCILRIGWPFSIAPARLHNNPEANWRHSKNHSNKKS